MAILTGLNGYFLAVLICIFLIIALWGTFTTVFLFFSFQTVWLKFTSLNWLLKSWPYLNFFFLTFPGAFLEGRCYFQPCRIFEGKFSSVAQSCPILYDSMNCSTILSSVIPFSSCLQSFPASGSFPSESVLCIRWPKDWSFSFSISPSNEYSEWISFRIDWFELLAVQGTLKSLLQHHRSKASILHSPIHHIHTWLQEKI